MMKMITFFVNLFDFFFDTSRVKQKQAHFALKRAMNFAIRRDQNGVALLVANVISMPDVFVFFFSCYRKKKRKLVVSYYSDNIIFSFFSSSSTLIFP